MDFKDKYTIKDEEGKIKISVDAYAVGDMISELIKKIEQTRLSLI